jgi:hypothetical protein
MSEYSLVVRPKPDLPVGVHRAEVEVTAMLADGHTTCRRNVTVQAEIVPDIQATPAQVYFGARPQGGKCEEAVLIHSLTGSAFTIADRNVEGTGLVVEKAEQATHGQTDVFLLSQDIANIGRQAGKVVFAVKNPDGKRAEVTVPVEYHGISSK